MINTLLKKYASDLKKTKPKRKVPPLSSVYLYSKYCNLKCRHCWINPPYSDTREIKKDEASLKSILSALDECRELGMKTVKLTGGEPFARGDIFEILEYIKKNKLRIHMETNGVLIGKKEAKALKDAGATQVAVSLDGPTAEMHDAFRGVEGAFIKSFEGIKNLVDQGIRVQIIFSLWKGNADHLKSVIVLAKALGVSSVKINPINVISRANTMNENKEVFSVKEVIEYYKKLLEDMKKEPKMNVIFDIPPAFRPIINMKLSHSGTCGIFGILGILGDGNISICGIGSSSNTLVLGQIGKDKIKDIWENHSILNEIRDHVPSNIEGVCGKCMLKTYCLGKCRAEAYYNKGSLLAPLTFCQTAYEDGLFPESRLIS